MPRGSNPLPGNQAPSVPGARSAGLPAPIAGGAWGPVAIPSRLASPVGDMPSQWGGPYVPGGNSGVAPSPRIGPPTAPATAPFPFTGVNNGGGGPLRNAGGGPITWYRHRYANTAGQQQFNTGGQATTGWTSNSPDTMQYPTVPIPNSSKFINAGGYRREQFVDEQLYPILPRWIIQRGVRNYVAGWGQRPATNPPYQPRLTSYAPSGSYGSTTPTLQSQLLTNLLSSTQSEYQPY